MTFEESNPFTFKAINRKGLTIAILFIVSAYFIDLLFLASFVSACLCDFRTGGGMLPFHHSLVYPLQAFPLFYTLYIKYLVFIRVTNA